MTIERNSLTIDGVGTLKPGTVFSVKGSHGRFKFQTFVKNEKTGSEWVEAFGGVKNHSEFRAFRVNQINRTYRS